MWVKNLVVSELEVSRSRSFMDLKSDVFCGCSPLKTGPELENLLSGWLSHMTEKLGQVFSLHIGFLTGILEYTGHGSCFFQEQAIPERKNKGEIRLHLSKKESQKFVEYF